LRNFNIKFNFFKNRAMQFAQSQTLTESRDAGRNITKRNLATFGFYSLAICFCHIFFVEM